MVTTLQDRIAICKKCTNRTFDHQVGILCGLTSAKPAFEHTCDKFVRDESVKDYVPSQEKVVTVDYVKHQLPNEVIEKLRLEQNLPGALIGGGAASLAGAALWALVTILTQYQIGYMALGVGALVGLVIRYFGKGMDNTFGIIGAGFALFGCLIGNFLSVVGAVSIEYHIDFFKILSVIHLKDILIIMKETFSPIDVVFYAIAIAEGYKLAIRKFTEKDLHQIKMSN